MLYQKLTQDFAFEDERGNLVQLVHTGYEQVNIVSSRAGVTRGGHYHKWSREAFYVVSGCVEVSLLRDGEREEVKFQKGDFFLIPPGVTHSMFYP